MAQITRYDGNLKPFADDSLGTERTVFGAETQSDALDDNINTDFFRGWGIVGVNELPTKQDFNAVAYTTTALTSYLFQRGIAEYHASQEFFAGSITFEDGLLYKAVQGTTGNLPSDDDGTNWNEFLGITGYDAITTYHANSMVRKVGTFEIYASLADGNVGNALPNKVDDANWKYVGDLSTLTQTTGKKILGHGYAETGAYASSSNNVPLDNTSWQNTEGSQALTLSYTPQSDTSKLIVEFGGVVSPSSNYFFCGLALFKDADANATAVIGNSTTSSQYLSSSSTVIEIDSTDTVQIDFALRYAANGGTAHLNGTSSGAKFNGGARTYIKITEIEA